MNVLRRLAVIVLLAAAGPAAAADSSALIAALRFKLTHKQVGHVCNETASGIAKRKFLLKYLGTMVPREQKGVVRIPAREFVWRNDGNMKPRAVLPDFCGGCVHNVVQTVRTDLTVVQQRCAFGCGPVTNYPVTPIPQSGDQRA